LITHHLEELEDKVTCKGGIIHLLEVHFARAFKVGFASHLAA
jgi:hypothetical protein